MIDWNNDGWVDPTEVVLTDIILEEQDAASDEAAENVDYSVYKRKESWIERLFRRRKDV